jgi:hypothetical protein
VEQTFLEVQTSGSRQQLQVLSCSAGVCSCERTEKHSLRCYFRYDADSVRVRSRRTSEGVADFVGDEHAITHLEVAGGWRCWWVHFFAPDFPPQFLQRTFRLYVQAWHSVDTLRAESAAQLQQRRYAMAYYSCPLQAGNRLHNFLNSQLWGIITKRTVLHHYLGCSDLSLRSCEHKADCDQVLERAAWTPSYADWSSKLSWNNDLSETVTIVDYWSVHSFSRVATWEQKRFPKLNGTTTAKVNEMIALLIDFPQSVNKDATLNRFIQRNEVLATASARERTAGLFALGTDFLYGMLCKDVFRFTLADVEKDKTPKSLRLAQPNLLTETKFAPSFSIAINSRHRTRHQDGSNVEKETQCLIGF